MNKMTEKEIKDLLKKFSLIEGNASIEGVDLSNMDLSNTNFSSASLDNINFNNTDLSNAYFSHTQLSEVTFRKATLCGATFLSITTAGLDFREANLSNADLTDATLIQACFDDADLINAKCYLADFEEATFSNTDLRGTSLYGARLHDTTADGSGFKYLILSGSKNQIIAVQTRGKIQLEIGREIKFLEEWEKDYDKLLVLYGYTPTEIQEYYSHIQTCKQYFATREKTDKRCNAVQFYTQCFGDK